MSSGGTAGRILSRSNPEEAGLGAVVANWNADRLGAARTVPSVGVVGGGLVDTPVSPTAIEEDTKEGPRRWEFVSTHMVL